MNKQIFIGLAFGSLVLFGIIGYLVIRNVYDIPPYDVILGPQPWYWQIGVGTLVGLASAAVGWFIIRTALLKDVREFYSDMIKPLQLNLMDIIFISFCAGFGEEILFRGAIQPWLGVWLTAIIFVAIHGYLNPKNWKLSVYGGFMTVAIAGIGYLADYAGLLSAMVAHTVIDIFLLIRLTNSGDSEKELEIEHPSETDELNSV